MSDVPRPAEHRLHELLEAVHAERKLDVYAYADSAWRVEPHALDDARIIARELVAARLARWTDSPPTTLELTSFGRYWSAHGGYFAFLRHGDEASAPRERGGRGGEDGDVDPALRREL